MDRFAAWSGAKNREPRSRWDTPTNTFGKAFSTLFSDRDSGMAHAFSAFSGSRVGSAWKDMQGTFGTSSPFLSGSGMGSISSWAQSGRPPASTSGYGAGQNAANAAAGVLGGGGGKATRDNTFGQFSKTPQVWDYIDQAAAKYGVDANIMQVFIARESSGDWAGNGNAGRGMYIGRSPWYDTIYPFIGTYKKTALSRGVTEAEWAAAEGNMGAQVDMLGRMLRSMIDQNGFTSPEQLFAYYFSGQTDPNSTWSDGSMTVQQYVGNAMSNLNSLGGLASGGLAGGGGLSGGAPGVSGAISSIWGGRGERDLSYGFGAPNNLGLYAYGASYGLDGSAHTGVDIPMNIGEPVVSPVSGTVVCGGTGVGPGADGGGCAAFNDVMGKGAGRVEVQLDNGETVIFGHMSTSNFRPGQRVNAGDVIGEAGGMNGGHVHLEWRVRDPGTPSGWRLVDPMGKLGQGGSTFSSAPQQQNQTSAGFTTTIGNTFQRTPRYAGGFRF